ncbi:hypothetical protein ABKN59_001439 [Abortiporus biennis]
MWFPDPATMYTSVLAGNALSIPYCELMFRSTLIIPSSPLHSVTFTTQIVPASSTLILRDVLFIHYQFIFCENNGRCLPKTLAGKLLPCPVIVVEFGSTKFFMLNLSGKGKACGLCVKDYTSIGFPSEQDGGWTVSGNVSVGSRAGLHFADGTCLPPVENLSECWDYIIDVYEPKYCAIGQVRNVPVPIFKSGNLLLNWRLNSRS